MLGIAWQYLDPIQQAQLLHCRPDLAKSRCKKCGGPLDEDGDQYGTYISCLFCGAEHNPDGGLVPTRDPIAEGINTRACDRRLGDRLPNSTRSHCKICGKPGRLYSLTKYYGYCPTCLHHHDIERYYQIIPNKRVKPNLTSILRTEIQYEG